MHRGNALRSTARSGLVILLLAGASHSPRTPGDTTGHAPQASLAFEPNLGQSNAGVDFLARGKDYRITLDGAGVMAWLDDADGAAIGMTFAAGNRDAVATGTRRLDSRSHYFIGSDPSLWRHVPHFGAVRYDDVYPGIDAVYYGVEGNLEYDLVVEPGADPGIIALDFHGIDALRIDAAGDLLLGTSDDAPVQHRPVVYQVVDGARRLVDGAYRLLDADTAGFVLGAFDASLPLVIDPVISYASYLGGDSYDRVGDIAVNRSGHTWVVGNTESTDFAGQPGEPGNGMACRFIGPGTTPTCLYIGGSQHDFINAIAFGADGSIHLAGYTRSVDFPTVNPYQPLLRGGGQDMFVARIEPSLDAISFATYLGGSDEEEATAVAVGAGGATVVAGSTRSPDFPATGGASNVNHGGEADAIVARFEPDGTAVFATLLGGSDHELPGGLVITAGGDIVVAGSTYSIDLPVMDALQPTFGGALSDAFFARFDGEDGGLIQASYLGGGGVDRAAAIHEDRNGHLVLAGWTNVPFHGALPMADEPPKQNPGGAFIARLAPGGDAIVSNVLLGDTVPPVTDMALDDAGNAHIVGNHDYWDIDPDYDPKHWAIARTVVAGVPVNGRGLMRLHAFEGSATETACCIAVANDGAVLVASMTTSEDLPVIAARQPVATWLGDIHVIRFSEPALGPGAGDYDGDGRDDILWRNGDTGENVVWPAANAWAAMGLRWVRDLDWDIAGAGDFNGDGRSDIFWRNGATGANALWLAADASSVQATAGVGNTNWKVHAVGDFDGDGSDDLAWHQVTTGQTTVWFGASTVRRMNLVTVRDLAWDILGAGDFDGDGTSDLLWRHAVSGAMVGWRQGNYATPLPVRGVSDPAWQLVAIGDFDGNGRDDLAWRHMIDGRNVIWPDADPTRVRSNAATSMAWEVAGTGDHDGDGTDDLLWRNHLNGANVIWKSGRSNLPRKIDGISEQDWTNRS